MHWCKNQEVQVAVQSLLQLSSKLRFCSGVKEGLKVNVIVEGQNGLLKLFLGILVTFYERTKVERPYYPLAQDCTIGAFSADLQITQL